MTFPTFSHFSRKLCLHVAMFRCVKTELLRWVTRNLPIKENHVMQLQKSNCELELTKIRLIFPTIRIKLWNEREILSSESILNLLTARVQIHNLPLEFLNQIRLGYILFILSLAFMVAYIYAPFPNYKQFIKHDWNLRKSLLHYGVKTCLKSYVNCYHNWFKCFQFSEKWNMFISKKNWTPCNIVHVLNISTWRKRGVAYNPLFIIPGFFLHFSLEPSYGYLRFEGNGKIPLGR